jgi:hypothetical protein
MLQAVNKESTWLKASSIYCVWVCRKAGSPLTAVWIDSGMTEFEQEFKLKSETGIADECRHEQSVEVQLIENEENVEEV